ncbi:cytochrome P450 [Saccharopolyspora halophila]|uniref:Cytochrome P450 n=1 Tax=Saccharopolyspora halophila TaxID=405551 RepID=A0ABN3GKJ4_9PSEU
MPPSDGTDARKIKRGEEAGDGCPVSRGEDGVWRVRGHAAARALLRHTETVQAGLGVETIEKMPAKIRRPVLYRDGPEHREHRRQTAKYFTPRKVDDSYRELMHRASQTQLAKIAAPGVDLSDLSFGLAVDVASAVIGLKSTPGLAHRLERFFPEEFGEPGFTSLHGLYWVWRQAVNYGGIFIMDVLPSVRARRKQRADDVVSHLLDEGCSPAEILGECITFAAAGMVTTREFINLAAWHLFTDEALRERYLAAEETDRIAILHELLRLEPVVSNLKRRATADIELPGSDGESVAVAAGETVDIEVTATNLDPATMGELPRSICPGREINEGTAPGMSFGDGAHRCPGNNIAMLETDVFLTRLFALPGVRMVSEPRVSFNDAIGGYVLRGLVVTTGS